MHTPDSRSERTRIRRTRRPTALRAAAIALAVLGTAVAAQARVETLRWEHPTPGEVDGFRVYVGSQSGNYTRTVDARKPANSNGVFEYGLSVADDATAYIAVSAYRNDGSESPLSNERVRKAPTSGGGTDGGTDGGSSDGGSGDGSSGGGSTDGGSTGGGGSADAIFYDDLEYQAKGSHLSGWVDTEAGSSMTENDALFWVSDFGGSRVISTTSTKTDIHSHYVSGGSGDWSAYEVAGRMRGSATASRLGVTAYSGFPSEDVYYRLGTHWQTAELELFRHPTPDASFQCSKAGTGVTLREDRWYRFRMQVQPGSQGTTVRAKVWADGAAEPTGWSADCFDTRPGRPTSGTIGLWSGSGGTKYWDDLEVTPLGSGALGAPGRPMLILP